jgi:diketogulonate reductase-like aldo/keto reductase
MVKIVDTKARLFGRREFNVLCAALGLSQPTVKAMADALSSMPAALAGPASSTSGRTVRFRDGTIVPALGQGTWHLAQGRHPEAIEEEALLTGISLGMTVIDTAEIYSDGSSEKLISRVIASRRNQIFLVSKVAPYHVAGDGIARACEASLDRLGTDYLDLYLLHWRNPDTDLSKVVDGFERLRARDKIRAWGVSNFKVSDMEDLFRTTDGHRCATNQVRYNLGSRAVEYDLLPWCREHDMPVMAYSPLGDGGLLHDPLLGQIGTAHDCSGSAIALAWAIRGGNVIAITESGVPAHVRENAGALSLMLTTHEIQRLDAAFPLRWADIMRFLLDGGKRWLRDIEYAL